VTEQGVREPMNAADLTDADLERLADDFIRKGKLPPKGPLQELMIRLVRDSFISGAATVRDKAREWR